MRRLSLLFALASLFAFGCPAVVDDDDGMPDDLDQITSEDRPTKRAEVLAIADEGSNSIAIFGGNDGPIVGQIPQARFRDDTWVFEPGSGWTEVAGDGPSARGRYAAAHDPDGGRMLIFGGRWREEGTSGDYTLLDDLWSFDFATREWTELDAGGNGPAGRYYPGGAWDSATQTFWLWGGATNTSALIIQPSAELWSWTSADGWTEHDTSGEAPSSRVFFGTTHDTSRNRLILFAGQVGDFQSLAFNDLYALSLDSGEWEQLDGGGNGAPFTRMHPALQYDAARDRIVLFGGHTDIGDDNDLWEFPAGGGDWDTVLVGDTFTGNGLGCALDPNDPGSFNPSEVPADYVDQDTATPERRHRGMHALLWDNLWIFGGMHAECSDQLDDTWRYDLEDNSWHELIEARTGESCLRRGEDCNCLCI